MKRENSMDIRGYKRERKGWRSIRDSIPGTCARTQPASISHSYTLDRTGSSPVMNSSAKRIIVSAVAILFTIGLTLARSIDSPDPDGYQKNQAELSYQELPLDNALFKYILAKEILTRQKNYDMEERERKRNYWKQCAFNAVSCFGKK